MHRHLDKTIKEHFDRYKQILILLGSRQTGKTTLVKKVFSDFDYLLVDNEPIRKILETYDIESYKTLFDLKNKKIIIDEIHLLSDPGRCAKIIFDQLEGVKLVITGSSSFHIKNKTGESLAGRKIDYYLFPLTLSEYLQQTNIEKFLNFKIFENILKEKNVQDRMHKFDMDAILNNILVYGQYPYTINSPRDKKYLENFVDSLIFKDIIELNLIEDKRLAKDLLRLLSLQIGNLISYSELANSLKADQRTIKRYIEIFEQSFVLFRLYPYSKNKRDEISKSAKIYFYDTGVRNALINNFSDLDLRNDKGALFENFIICELIKQNNYLNKDFKFYYWRTKQGSEIDLVLENKDILLGLEVKYKQKSINKAFKSRYTNAQVKIITSSNFY